MTHIKSFSILTSKGMNEEKQQVGPEIKFCAVRLSNKVILIAVKLENWMLDVWKKNKQTATSAISALTHIHQAWNYQTSMHCVHML